MENIFWTGYSNDERHAAINTIQHVISKYGFIVDFHLFSDMAMSVTIEIDAEKIDSLYEALSEIISIRKPDILLSNTSGERRIYLNITFAQGTGNLSIEVPSVPG